ncbi:MAG TPA: glycosyltransferase family 39 protein [Candidatus Polarisedimenticolia bacterium]|nr:glycosyltransferase family 39 protein [Candidatus Polarisedimenticolia bacterium]
MTAADGERSGAIPAAILTLLAAAIRFGTLTKQALWMDEYIWTLTGGLKSISAILNRPDGYPPTIAFLVKTLTSLGLDSDFALRAPSALAGTLAVPVLYLLGRRLLGRTPALVAAGLLAVHPFAVWYSLELGAYALLSLFALTASLALLRLLDGGGLGAALGYALSVWAGFGVHYYFAFVVVAHCPFALAALLRTGGAARRPLWACATLTAVALLFWAPLFLDDVRAQREHDRGAAASLFALPYTGQMFAGGFALGPPLREMHAAVRAGATPTGIPLRQMTLPVIGIAILGGLVLLGLGAGWRGRRWFVLTLAVLPFLGPWLNSLAGVGYRPRYAVAALAFTLLIAAGGLATPRRRTATALLAALLLCELYGLVKMYHPDHAREDTRSAAIFIAAGGGGPVLLLGEGAEAYKRYSRSRGALVDLDLADVKDSSRLDTLLQAATAEGSDVWLVSSRPWTEDPDGEVPRRLGALLRPAESKRFAGVVVQRFVHPSS